MNIGLKKMKLSNRKFNKYIKKDNSDYIYITYYYSKKKSIYFDRNLFREFLLD